MNYQSFVNILALVLILHLVYLFGYYDGARHGIYVVSPHRKTKPKIVSTGNIVKLDFKKSIPDARPDFKPAS